MNSGEAQPRRWYAVKAILRIDIYEQSGQMAQLSAVEERITLVSATSMDDALSTGETLARSYANSSQWLNSHGDRVTTRFLEACDVFAMDSPPIEGAEIYSKIFCVPASAVNSQIVDRFLGTPEEQLEQSAGLFEPDFEREAEQS